MATASARVATVPSSRQLGVQPTLRRSVRPGEQATSSTSARLGEPATPRTSAGPDSRAELLEALLRVDAEVKTTMLSSLRRPTSRGSAQFATASRKRMA